jgi:ATP-dependent DNA helicase RecQ
MQRPTKPRIHGLQNKLRRHFGFKRFRAGQAEAVEATMGGRDVVVVMPTGSGKSLCYQLPALEMNGSTVIVSPLISLMKDQADSLRANGFNAAEMNSAVPLTQTREYEALIAAGKVEFIFATPEKLTDSRFRGLLRKHSIGLFVVDEAHCISHWGHDFRPDFLSLADAIDDLGRPPVLALTATATTAVIDDIRTKLRIPDSEVVHTGFYRSNLTLAVHSVTGEAEKHAKLLEVLGDTAGTAIIYCATVKSVDELTDFLAQQGVVAAGYHGRMNAKQRAKIQARFMNGELHRFVATNAFGLGIDKPDIRAVIHYHFPGSLEAYYQEFGRAGRDSRPAKCTLLYDREDTRLQRFFQFGRYPDDADLVNAYHSVQRLQSRPELPTFKDIQTISPLKSSTNKICLSLLVAQGIIERQAGDRYRMIKPGLTRDAIAAAGRAYRDKEEQDRIVLKKMIDYAEKGGCRWRTVLDYFEDDALMLGHCHHCDNCPAVPDEAVRLAALRKSVEALKSVVS